MICAGEFILSLKTLNQLGFPRDIWGYKGTTAVIIMGYIKPILALDCSFSLLMLKSPRNIKISVPKQEGNAGGATRRQLVGWM